MAYFFNGHEIDQKFMGMGVWKYKSANHYIWSSDHMTFHLQGITKRTYAYSHLNYLWDFINGNGSKPFTPLIGLTKVHQMLMCKTMIKT